MPAPRLDKGKLRTEPGVDHIAVISGQSFEECRALYVGTGGDATITVNGNAVLYKNLQGGMIVPLQATMVTYVTASDIVALY